MSASSRGTYYFVSYFNFIIKITFVPSSTNYMHICGDGLLLIEHIGYTEMKSYCYFMHIIQDVKYVIYILFGDQ